MKFSIKKIIKSSPKEIYKAWLSNEGHSAMTGGSAEISEEIGASFSAWDGYIEGENIELIPFSYIKQSWRTSEFEDSDEDSILEIRLHEIEGGTELSLEHRNLPAHGEQYIQGWEDHYFSPMLNYFS